MDASLAAEVSGQWVEGIQLKVVVAFCQYLLRRSRGITALVCQHGKLCRFFKLKPALYSEDMSGREVLSFLYITGFDLLTFC